MKALFTTLSGVVLALAANTSAADIGGNASELYATSAPSGATRLVIAGPGDIVLESESLSVSAPTALPDGSYRYVIFGADYRSRQLVDLSDTLDVKATLNNGRDTRSRSARLGTPETRLSEGDFRLVGGSVVMATQEEEY